MENNIQTILLTGASGFLGTEIARTCSSDFNILTLGQSSSNAIICDLGDEIPDLQHKVNIVIHAAGKAHMVPKTEAQKEQFMKINFNGTKNLCLALEKSGNIPESFIFMSTIAVYGLESGNNVPESAPLLGVSAYSVSKIKAEEFLLNWCEKRQIKLIILRLPLIAGSKAPGNLGAMINAIQKGFYFRIGKGLAKKSMVLVDDLADFVPNLINKSGIYNLTDNYHPSISELDTVIASYYGKKVIQIPEFLIYWVALVGNFIPFIPINSYKFEKLNATLTFDDSLARRDLKWNPSKVIDKLFV